MFCPNNMIGFQNFRCIIVSASLTVTHMFKLELRNTNTRTIINSFISYPYDSCVQML
jgi:hypothetical protein